MATWRYLLGAGLLAVGCQFSPDPVGWPGEDRTDAGNPFGESDAAPGSTSDADPGAPDGAPITGLYSLNWNSQRWLARGNLENALAGYPQFNGSEVILTPDVPGRSAAIFMSDTVTPPFMIDFDYQTTDPDGCGGGSCLLNSASGLVFMFGKDVGAYTDEDPPSGDARGFISGRGAGVHFELYSQRVVSVRDSYLTSLKSAEVETFSPSYRHVTVDVHTTGLDVYLDGNRILEYLPAAAWSTAYYYIGFGAATGNVSTEQRIRDVVLY